MRASCAQARRPAACSLGSGLLAAAMIVYVVRQVRREGNARTLLNRDTWLVYVAFIAVMWNLWFFSFWSVQIVTEAAHSSFMAASLTAAFNAGAGIIGFPVGGWIADRRIRAGKGRKPLAIACAGHLACSSLPGSWRSPWSSTRCCGRSCRAGPRPDSEASLCRDAGPGTQVPGAASSHPSTGCPPPQSPRP